MASASSSSGSVPNALREYDVFISFRGEDTRSNFTGHLYAALNRAAFQVFRDDKKLEKGHEIASALSQAIKGSSVSVIVFSEDYASSKWCLDELHQIMQYTKDKGQIVIPIFHRVSPKDVRNQTGAYQKAFKKHEKNYRHDPDKVKRWRDALSEAGKLSGWECKTSTDESNLIEEIVADVCTKLELMHNCHVSLKDVIGISEMVKPIKKLLKKSHKVGIWGMGGVGKTTMAKVTMAKVVLNPFPSQYKPCFLENVREETEKKGLKHVRDALVSKLLGENMQIDSSNEASVFRRLGRIKAFVVLDDVDTAKQLEKLQDNTCNFLGEGSKVIITTRDQKLLKGKGYEIHEVKGLSSKNSRRLFIRKAFGSDNAKDGYEELIEGFVDYTKHNPLALEVLGLYVHCEDKKLWGDLLRKLRAGKPSDKIQEVLSLSYDRLNREEKQIFLNIACFLKGESEEFVRELMESCGFYPIVHMQTLKDKALIDTTSGKVEMHDLIQEMGRQIAREENRDDLGRRKRLWDPREICDILKNCEGEKEVEGIMMDTFENIGALEFTAKSFNKMTRLRFLKLFFSRVWMVDVSIPSSLESISTQIRYFHWIGYPMKSLPSNFCAKYLVELSLGNSLVETLWEGVQDLPNLRRLDLYWCYNLRELPDVSKACRLESVNLNGCRSLCYVHESLLSLHSLISLDVSYCGQLKSLQSRIHLKSLKEIKIAGCQFKEFCVSSEALTSLTLSYTKTEELGPSIGLCSKLTTLYFVMCENLTGLPDCITQLSSLEKLHFTECPRLTKLPDNMRLLSKLQYLSVQYCTALQSLPELPPSLRTLIATDCKSLETVSPSTISSTPQNKGKKFFSFNNCVKLDLGTIEEQVKLLLEKAVHEKEHVEVYYPGKKVPEWFGNNLSQNDSDTLKLSLSSHTLVGFVFGAVDPELLLNGSTGHLDVVFNVEDDEMTEKVVEHGLIHFTYENVLLRSNPKASDSILEKIEGKRRNHDATTYNPNLSFELRFYRNGLRCPTEEFGVYPIYAHQGRNSRKRKAVMID